MYLANPLHVNSKSVQTSAKKISQTSDVIPSASKFSSCLDSNNNKTLLIISNAHLPPIPHECSSCASLFYTLNTSPNHHLHESLNPHPPQRHHQAPSHHPPSTTRTPSANPTLPLPPHPPRNPPPSHLPQHPPPRLPLLNPQPLRPLSPILGAPAIPPPHARSLLLRPQTQPLQRLLRQNRLVLDLPRLPHLPPAPPLHRAPPLFDPHPSPPTGSPTLHHNNGMVGSGHAMVLRPRLGGPRVPPHGREMRASANSRGARTDERNGRILYGHGV